MRFVNYKLSYIDGQIEIPLSVPCKEYVALVEISIPSFDLRREIDNAVDITCNQIDSTFDNPNRLLRRIPFNLDSKNRYYQNWTTQFLQMNKVDSDDKFLTLYIRRTTSNENLQFKYSSRENFVYVTLAFSQRDLERWTTYI